MAELAERRWSNGGPETVNRPETANRPLDSRVEDRLTVGLVQMSMSPDPGGNLARALDLVADAAAAGARLVCLPELFSWRYFCQVQNTANFALSEPVPGPTTRALETLAADLDLTVVAGVFERRAPGLYHNAAVFIDGSRGYRGKYRKMHIPDEPGYREKYYFTPGDLGFRPFRSRWGTCGVLLCWDQWYPEAARLAALQGARILLYPTAIGWHPDDSPVERDCQAEAWELMQRSHGIANGCFVIAVNRVGFEPAPGRSAAARDGAAGIGFWGRSFVSAPDGHVLGRASAESDEVLIAELDLAAVERHRVEWPFLRDRRVDAYAGLTARFLDGPDASATDPVASKPPE